MFSLFTRKPKAAHRPLTIPAKPAIPNDLFQTYAPYDKIHEPPYFSKTTGRFYQKLANGQFVECAPNPIVAAFRQTA